MTSVTSSLVLKEPKMTHPVKAPKKLIEVALPLDAINAACIREKSIRHGHPNAFHLWWARRPLAAARAVIFGQLVNDPAGLWEVQNPGKRPNSQQRSAWTRRRKELFDLIEKLVLWENTTNEEVLELARAEIRRSWSEVCELNKDHPQAADLFNPDKLPALHDPFAGGGAIPLEAQRLSLEAYASDLNPVSVLINKAMIEIPPKFAGRAPVGPLPPEEEGTRLDLPKVWPGATGLAEDVRRYGAWMRAEAQNRIGHLYPPVEITVDMARERPDLKPLVGQKLTVIVWIWARTVKSPNPAFSHVEVPLAANFFLRVDEGKEVFVQPVVNGDKYHFRVKVGTPSADVKNGTKAEGRGSNFRCVVSNTPISGDYIKAEGEAGRLGAKLMAVVAEGTRGRVYLSPTTEMEAIALNAKPIWRPTGNIPARLTGGTCVPYGLKEWGDLFTSRQLVGLTTFGTIVAELQKRISRDALSWGISDDQRGLELGGEGAHAYAEAIRVYLAFQIDQLANHLSTICAWHVNNEQLKNTFARQSLPMTWDFAETNPFSTSTGSLNNLQERQIKAFASLTTKAAGFALQADAAVQSITRDKIISTDPPYYDNIAYADLSDFFYVWTRHNLRDVFPRLLATIAAPKEEELVATAYRHGGKEAAEEFFLNGMSKAMRQLVEQAHSGFPITIYYAFKQSDTKNAETSSTGWEIFLDAVFQSGFLLTGTWPVRTEQTAAMKTGTNALASSIVLVCRKRPADAVTISRREFLRELNAVLPEALDEMTKGSGDERSPIAPVDLSQAIIGPGMAVFSKYSAVLEADGKPMSVKTALQLINRFLAEDEFDHDTQFCLHWFEQYGWKEGKFGDADTLARAKGTSVDGVKQAGVLLAAAGVVRLFKWTEYPTDWDPTTDHRLPVWEALHHLIRVFKTEGEAGAGVVLSAILAKGEAARQLAYRLYTLCERAGLAEDARAYNEIISSWSAIESAAAKVPGPLQATLFG